MQSSPLVVYWGKIYLTLPNGWWIGGGASKHDPAKIVALSHVSLLSLPFLTLRWPSRIVASRSGDQRKQTSRQERRNMHLEIWNGEIWHCEYDGVRHAHPSVNMVGIGTSARSVVDHRSSSMAGWDPSASSTTGHPSASTAGRDKCKEC